MAGLDLTRGALHTLPDRVVERARTLAGGGLAGVYLTDVEGACLLRLAGDAERPCAWKLRERSVQSPTRRGWPVCAAIWRAGGPAGAWSRCGCSAARSVC